MGLWTYIISHTSHSPGKLLVFGSLCIAATAVVGNIFTSIATPSNAPGHSRRDLERMPADSRRFVTARDQRLSHMIKDIVDGKGEHQHWDAAMRGTLVTHPNPENKTQGIDAERLAKLKPK